MSSVDPCILTQSDRGIHMRLRATEQSSWGTFKKKKKRKYKIRVGPFFQVWSRSPETHYFFDRCRLADDHSVFLTPGGTTYAWILQSYAWGASVQRRASETRAPRFSLQRRAFSYSAARLVTAPRFQSQRRTLYLYATVSIR